MTDPLRTYEHAAERARARLDLQLEALQARLTPQGLADEALGALRQSSYGRLADDAAAAVRRNPLPLVVAGAALAVFAIQLGEERMRNRRPPASARTARPTTPNFHNPVTSNRDDPVAHAVPQPQPGAAFRNQDSSRPPEPESLTPAQLKRSA